MKYQCCLISSAELRYMAFRKFSGGGGGANVYDEAQVVVTIRRIRRCVFTTRNKMCGQEWIHRECLGDLSENNVLFEKFRIYFSLTNYDYYS